MTDEQTQPELSPLEAVEARRAARKAEIRAQWEAQRIADLEALDALEIELGDSNVAYLDVPFTDGLPTLAAVRCPTSAEVKRYQARVKGKPDKPGDPTVAAEELGAVALKYPPKGETRDRLLAARAGLLVGLGVLAINLSTGKVAEQGKD